jgi:hypothetical protein
VLLSEKNVEQQAISTTSTAVGWLAYPSSMHARPPWTSLSDVNLVELTS